MTCGCDLLTCDRCACWQDVPVKQPWGYTAGPLFEKKCTLMLNCGSTCGGQSDESK
jgi:hypothetical protein